MGKSRIITLVILAQFILLFMCIGALAYTRAHQNEVKIEAKRYATIAGKDQATRNYLRGNYGFYEVQFFDVDPANPGTAPEDGSIRPANKRDGELPIYYFLVGRTGWPKWHAEVQQAYIDAYNDRMRLMFGHPNWFDQNGERIPQPAVK